MNELAPRSSTSAVSRPASSVRRPTPCRLLEWKPVNDNVSLVGRCTVCFSGGWIVSGVPIFRRADGSLSPGTPSVPLLDANGLQLRDEHGKRAYAAIIKFESREARDRWDDAILTALRDGGVT